MHFMVEHSCDKNISQGLKHKYVFTLFLIEYFAVEGLTGVGTLELTSRSLIVTII